MRFQINGSSAGDLNVHQDFIIVVLDRDPEKEIVLEASATWLYKKLSRAPRATIRNYPWGKIFTNYDLGRLEIRMGEIELDLAFSADAFRRELLEITKTLHVRVWAFLTFVFWMSTFFVWEYTDHTWLPAPIILGAVTFLIGMFWKLRNF